MSRHEISGSVPRMEAGFQELRIPLNAAKFRAYRDMTRAIATMGVSMTIGFCGFPAALVYIWIIDPTERKPALAIAGMVLSVVLLLFVGIPTWPAMQKAKTLTDTVTEKLPALVVSSKGVWDYSSNHVFGFIPWNEITSVIATSRRAPRINKDFPGIAFIVKNKNVLLDRKPRLLRFEMSMEREINELHQVFVPQDRIAMPIEDAVEQINAFRARAKV